MSLQLVIINISFKKYVPELPRILILVGASSQWYPGNKVTIPLHSNGNLLSYRTNPDNIPVIMLLALA